MAQAIEAKDNLDAGGPPPLRITRILDHVRRETVFKAWTGTEHVRAWFCPQTYSVPDAHVEARVGGAFEVCMRSPSGEEHWTRGVFVEFEPDRRLVIDMHVTAPGGAPLFSAYTEVDFSDAPIGTRVDIVQSYTFVDPSVAAPMVAGASEGWRTTLDKLEQVAVRLQGGSGVDGRSVVHALFHLERTYDAPIARVWKALTDPAAKQKWFGGVERRWEPIERRMDVRPGGRERVAGRWESGLVTTFDAVYHDVVHEARLVYTYEMYLDEKKISVSLATMQLERQGERTTLKVTEQGAFLDGYDDAGAREQGTALLLDAIGVSLKD